MVFALILLIWAQPFHGSGQPEASEQAAETPRTFKPARYKSIRFGESKAADVIKAFGKPVSDAIGTDLGRYLTYRDLWLVPGQVEFWVDPKTGIVHSMIVTPTRMTTTDVAALLGPGWTFSDWTFSSCYDQDDYPDGAPVYRHPGGEFRTMDFPHLGITVSLARGYALRVGEISYDSTPYGLEEDPCLTQKKKQPKRPK